MKKSMVRTVPVEVVTSGNAARLIGYTVRALEFDVAAGRISPVLTTPGRWHYYALAHVLALKATKDRLR